MPDTAEQVPDQEDVYDEKIGPLMTQIIAICKEHQLPFVASFQYGPEDFCSSALVPTHAAPLMQKLLAVIDASRDPRVVAFAITTLQSGADRDPR